MNVNFSSTDKIGEYLEGAKVIRMYTPKDIGLEGGLTIIFEKNGSVGIYIMGYTELGDWAYHFDHNGNFYEDTLFTEEINSIRLDNGFATVEDSIFD